jgi:GDP-L-fucose synthase
MKVVVAGNTGLVGSAIHALLQRNGYEVIGANRSVVDLSDFDETLSFIGDHRPQFVIDAAARVGGIGANNSRPVEFLIDNLLIQNNLMRSSFEHNVDKFVFLGSSCIYPRNSHQPIKEEYLLSGHLEQSNSAYAIAKIAGIELVKSYRKEYSKSWISMMPTNLYGPKDNFNLESSHVLPALIRRFVEAADTGLPSVALWGSGSPLREFLHVDDLARAVEIAVRDYDSNLHLNVGSSEEISIHGLAKIVAAASNFTGEIVWDSSKPDGTPRKILDSSRMRSLGWEPTITLEEGISSTVAWFRSASSRNEVRK